HVDHGKTTLLDYIRNSKVALGEVGGITQKIGAYQIEVDGKKVTFIDTPGHEAFTAMRARGARMTDIAIIVVAADDGIMPQTKEAIDHAKAAGVPIVLAINKIDKPGANIDKIKYAMTDLGLTPEEWGGNTIVHEISAKTGQGVDELLQTLLIVAEVQELRANPDREAFGTVIEAKLDKGKGPVANILVQNGTLNTGDTIVAGTVYGKVRRMNDDKGRDIKHALPSTPVSIIGLSDVPSAGDHVKVFKDEREARLVAEKRTQAKIEKERNATSAMTMNDLTEQIKEGNVQDVNMIIKADIQGSAEALKASMEKIKVDTVKLHVIHATAGAINESDIMLAAASNAIIYGFNVRPDANIRKKAEEEHVNIRLHDIIYKAIEEMEMTMKGMLAPEYKEVILGQAEVRQIYKVSKVGTIAGCMVTDGTMNSGSRIRLIRQGVTIYTGELGSLKRFKDDVKEVAQGYECGLTIKNFNDIKEGDIVEGFKEEEVKAV
ncbi:MAG: translation initiation factor IF-2, partial [Erysipelotrichales bacterium]|nr:translation initiation factor IF-2 [Erysipelotrichales bacterium]